MLFKCHEEQALLDPFNKLQRPKCNQWLLEGELHPHLMQPQSMSVNNHTKKI